MIKVCVFVEGTTEFSFFETNFMNLIKSKNPSIITDSNNLYIKFVNLGGNNSFKNLDKLKTKIKKFLNEYDLLTICFDFFRLPIQEMKKDFKSSKEIYENFYKLFEQEANSLSFIPYLSIHEFETLVFSNTNNLKQYIKDTFKKDVSFDKWKDIEFEIKEPSYLLKSKTDNRWNKTLDFINMFDESYLTYNDLFMQCIFFNKWIIKISNIIELLQTNKYNKFENEINKL